MAGQLVLAAAQRRGRLHASEESPRPGPGLHSNPAAATCTVPSITLGMVVKVVPIGRNQEYWPVGPFRHPRRSCPTDMPMVKAPYGRITAIDMETGEHAWMTPVGRGYEQLPRFKGREMPGDGHSQPHLCGRDFQSTPGGAGRDQPGGRHLPEA